jgi:cyclopropane fatty-acyl-phospholipid synthase-like methyltransferase
MVTGPPRDIPETTSVAAEGLEPTPYTTDVVYPSAFGVFQAPVHLAYAATLGRRGAPALDGAPFTYCDLGCGAGLTVCVLADCYPEAEFHGVDINREHLAQGRALADAAGLANVRFHEASFADLGSLPLPPFDFIAMGGVYSWIPAQLRAANLAFAQQALTECGEVFLHYGALPGNAQLDALYALMRQLAATADGDSLARFGLATRRITQMRQAGAHFFRANPLAAAWLDQLSGQDPRAMAHEVLNAQRASLWVADVAAEAAAAGLEPLVNAQLELNDLGLTAPEALRSELATLDFVTRETVLDALRNTNSRMDVLMRPGAPKETTPPPLWLDRLTRGPLREERRELSRRARLDLTGQAYDVLLAQIDGRARSLPDLLAAPAVRAIPDARQALERLVALKLVNVLRRPYAPPADRGGTVVSRLNRILLEEKVSAAGALPLASPVAGTQVLLPLEDRLALRAQLGDDLAEVWRASQAAGRGLRMGGRPIPSAEALREIAARRAAEVGEEMSAQLGRLGIMA